MIRLKDVARVELGPEDERGTLRYNQTPAVAIGVVRQSKANLVEVADAVKAELPAIERALPPGVELIDGVRRLGLRQALDSGSARRRCSSRARS